MITRPDRVQIWASQLAANDFPPICAMTGRPAEVWRRFRFATPPTWAYALLVLICLGGLGIIAYAVVITLTSQRATGYLPLTRASRRTVELVIWTPVALIILWLVLWVAAAAIGLSTSDPTVGTIAGVLFGIGVLALVAGLVGRLVITALVGPRAKVFEQQPGRNDRLVELRNLSPEFVVAVRHMQSARAAQMAVPN